MRNKASKPAGVSRILFECGHCGGSYALTGMFRDCFIGCPACRVPRAIPVRERRRIPVRRTNPIPATIGACMTFLMLFAFWFLVPSLGGPRTEKSSRAIKESTVVVDPGHR